MDTIKINKGKARLIAHRGLSGIECENTCAAFVAAGNRSYFGIETDVHVTADKHFVIIHDDNTERISGVPIDVERSTYEELSALRLFDKQTVTPRSDLCIPTLDEYIRICKRYGKCAVLELKNTMATDDVAAIVDTVKALGYGEETVFISFSTQNCIALRTLFPTASIQKLTTEWNDEVSALLETYDLDLDILHKRATRELVELIHARGRKINVWTVDEPARAEELISMGVDYVTTNILE